MQWFSYRRMTRERPEIGDHRPPSPLADIQSEGWWAECTTERLNVLNVLSVLNVPWESGRPGAGAGRPAGTHRHRAAFCNAVLTCTAGQDARSLAADAMRLDATLRKLSLIGEAASRGPEDIRALAPTFLGAGSLRRATG